MSLLSVNSDAKTIKSNKMGKYLTAILYLAPAKTSGYQTCPSATVGCMSSCLFTAGRGAMNSVQHARTRKTKLFFERRNEFIELLDEELDSFCKKTAKMGVLPSVRLNGTSDICWPNICPSLFSKYNNIVFYNYTKQIKDMKDYMRGKFPPNYYLTFSRSEENWDFCNTVLSNGHTVSVVFKNIPKEYEGWPVYNGDDHDLRFTDPPAHIIGLKAKGRAKKDKTGFVV